MNTAIAERKEQAVGPLVTSEQLELVKKTVAQGATDAELKLYLYDCQRQGVHPLDRLLHFTKRGGKYTPVTSIDLMRIRAAETGEYAGSDDASFDGADPIQNSWPHRATVTVWRFVQGQRCAFTATARWAEYFPGEQSGHMWKKMPHTMLAKCAEALALRKGFPRQLAGLYAKEELDQANGEPVIQIAAPPPDPPVGYPEWLETMHKTAETGITALQNAWKNSAREYRDYVTSYAPDLWTSIKQQASIAATRPKAVTS